MDRVPRPAGRRPKRGRLSRSAEFERVYRQGRSVGNRFLVLHSFPRAAAGEDPGAAGVRLGVSVSRRVGGAVDRNRVKRLLREAFGVLANRLPDDHDVVVVARPEVRGLAEREGLDGVRGALEELVDRSVATPGRTEAPGAAATRTGGTKTPGEPEPPRGPEPPTGTEPRLGTDPPRRGADVPARPSDPSPEDTPVAATDPDAPDASDAARRGVAAPTQEEPS